MKLLKYNLRYSTRDLVNTLKCQIKGDVLINKGVGKILQFITLEVKIYGGLSDYIFTMSFFDILVVVSGFRANVNNIQQ